MIESLGLLVLLGFDIAALTPVAYLRRSLQRPSEIFRNLRLLIKGGGYLLSRIALQYHRRK